jgi:arylformamidase
LTGPRGDAGWIDVTLPIAVWSVAWSGLLPVELTDEARLRDGAFVNVRRLACSLHTGTHADSPFHVADGGVPADRMDPALYMGPCVVVRVAATGSIGRSALASAIDEAVGPSDAWPAARLLVATGAPYDGRTFPARAPFFDPEAVEWLLESGVRLLGVDGPSVDPLDSKALPVHHLMFEAGGGVLENLALAPTVTGAYELSAAPLLVVGGDAAPVRALVRPLE